MLIIRNKQDLKEAILEQKKRIKQLVTFRRWAFYMKDI